MDEPCELPDFTPLFDAALPEDAPGSWIRRAIREQSLGLKP